MNEHDYITAEKLLLAEIDRDPHSARAARLLAFAGTVYFRNQDYVNAAIAWKKSEAIAPLDSGLRFSLAMAFIRMSHPDWARNILESLAAQNQKDERYPYWLGRIAYDSHEYNEAVQHFKQAIELDPRMARAYDNLGLCYYYQNQNDLAVSNYEKAIEIDQRIGARISMAIFEPCYRAAVSQSVAGCRKEPARSYSARSQVRQGAFPAWHGSRRSRASGRGAHGVP